MILPEHGGESVFQQDYLRGMQYNVLRQGPFCAFWKSESHTPHIRKVLSCCKRVLNDD